MPRRRHVFQVFEHRFCFGQARVDVLGIDADLAAVAPTDFARERLRATRRSNAGTWFFPGRCRRRSRPRAVFDFQVDAAGDAGARDNRSPARGNAGPALCAARPRGARILAVGSSLAISVTSRRSSCLLFDLARVAVLARALFLAMNSSSWRRLASMEAFVRSSCFALRLLIFQERVDLAGNIVSLPRDRSSV